MNVKMKNMKDIPMMFKFEMKNDISIFCSSYYIQFYLNIFKFLSYKRMGGKFRNLIPLNMK